MDILEETVSKVVQIKPRKGESILTYYLCVYQEGDDIRGELSLATQTSCGYLAKFGERIFIIGGEAGGTDKILRKSDFDQSEFDIPISRKNKKKK